jgi:hypothetical protein
VSDNDDDDEEKTLLRAAGVYMFHSSSSTEHVTKHLLTAPSTPDHLLRNQGKETLPSHWPEKGFLYRSSHSLSKFRRLPPKREQVNQRLITAFLVICQPVKPEKKVKMGASSYFDQVCPSLFGQSSLVGMGNEPRGRLNRIAQTIGKRLEGTTSFPAPQ